MKSFLVSLLLAVLMVLFVTSCGQLPDEQMLTNGKKLEAKEQFQKAIDQYDKLISVYPNSPLVPEAIHQQAMVYANGLQNYSVSIVKLERVVADYPENKFASRSQFMLGFIQANSLNDTAQARMAYKTFLERFPEHELVPSVEWELKYLGHEINEIPELIPLDTSVVAGSN